MNFVPEKQTFRILKSLNFRKFYTKSLFHSFSQLLYKNFLLIFSVNFNVF